MKIDNLRNDKGVAGLTILLSLIVMLFVIGLLIMVFALMGAGIKDSDTVKASETTTTTDTSLTLADFNVTLTECDAANQGTVTSVASVYNETTLVAAGNYTFAGCVLSVNSDSEYNMTLGNATYTFTHAGESWNVINDTVGGISDTTNWFDIFIVIGAMVVLILLVVIIITSIRNSGMMSGTPGNSAGNVGYA